MTSFFKYNDLAVRYRENGTGDPLLFLHGYLESLDIWNEFVSDLEQDYRVIRIDLPGHGQTGVPDQVSTMELMAKITVATLDHLNLPNATIIGHSMGGYAALAMLEHFEERIDRLILFHSHTRPDSEEVKDKRKREIRIIEEGQKRLLVRQNIPSMFALQNQCAFLRELKFTQSIASEHDDKGIISSIRGLMERPERSDILKNASIPCLNIIGRYDNYINFEDVSLKTELPPDGKRLILDHSGHMGFFEEKARSLTGIRNFIKNS